MFGPCDFECQPYCIVVLHTKDFSQANILHGGSGFAGNRNAHNQQMRGQNVFADLTDRSQIYSRSVVYFMQWVTVPTRFSKRFELMKNCLLQGDYKITKKNDYLSNGGI